ncbi:MAG: Uncharacterised protein [Cryomorphaceae bacterium]|nr:MAG: Uncharacterised protein [Cryomorphaceae bacterium]|tara:strand:- start:361 stop:546 length:186 start_codon:yes stop_codon:yes gene_type:complete
MIKNSTKSGYNLSIKNIGGEILSNFNIKSNTSQINLPHASGIYILEINDGSQTFFKKIVRN